MLLKAIVQCWKCSSINDFALSEEAKRFFCEQCDVSILETKKYVGWIYVMSNPNQHSVKIGQTKRSPADRAKQLVGTGIAGSFIVEAYFASSRPEKDERKVHERLKKYQISREHFSLPALDAIMKVRSALGGRDATYLRPQHADEYKRIVEANRAKMALHLKRPNNDLQRDQSQLVLD